MKAFRSFFEDNEDDVDFSTMPHDHLFAETHSVVTAHGGQLHNVAGSMHALNHRDQYSPHGWRVSLNPEYQHPNDPDHDPSEDFDSRIVSITNKLKPLGWKRSPIHDVTEDHHPHMDINRGENGFQSMAYTHPNGSMLYEHHAYDENTNETYWTNYEMRIPKP